MREYLISENELALARSSMDFALANGADKIRITLNKSLMDLAGTLNGEVDKVSHCLDRSMSISLFVDGRFGSFSTNRLEKEIVESFILRAIDTVRMLAPDSFRNLPESSRTATDATGGNELGLYDSSYEDVTPADRLRMALEASIFKNTVLEGFQLVSEEAEYSDSFFDTLVIDSQGTFCRHMETSFEYGVEMTLQDGAGNKLSGYWWDAAPFLKDLGYKDCCRKAMQRAAAQAGPRPRRSGRYNMVVDSECASRLVTPLLNALGGYSIQQKNSFLADSLGKKTFSEGLTIKDVCRTCGQTGSRLFDSEGVATTEHEIISSGVVNEYFLNTYIAGKMEMQPTIEDAIRPKIMPWPAAGLDREKIMRKCRNGILVTGFNGGNSNPATGDYSFGIEGFAFKDGKIVHPVREMLITGNLTDLWNSLVAAGDDARLCMSKLIPTLAFSNVDFSG